MKLRPAEVERVLRRPDPGLRAVLVYGPDEGLVRERAGALARGVVEDLADPFRVGEVTGTQLRQDPGRLADEAAALSLTGGRRVVRLRGVDDGAAGALEPVLGSPAGDSLIVVEAGDLGPRSRLRRLFEQAGNAAALACYQDDARTLEGVIRRTLAERDLRPTDDAVIHLCANLGGDRMVSRSELEKLSLYAAGTGTVTLEDAVACVGDSAAATLDDLAGATAARDPAATGRALGRALETGVSPVAALRAVGRHFQRLQLAAATVDAGRSAEEAMRALRPPVFFKRADAFRAALRAWSAADSGAAQAALAEAEILCKSTGTPANAACAAALMQLAGGTGDGG